MIPPTVLVFTGTIDTTDAMEGTPTMHETLTAIFRPSPHGYIASAEELPGANTQGATLDEARSNLLEAIQLILETYRALAEEKLVGMGKGQMPSPSQARKI